MTPVCPHSLYARSYIFSAGARLSVRPLLEERETYLTVDGEEGTALHPGEEVHISRADTVVRLIKIKSGDFYDILNQKLMDRRRPAERGRLNENQAVMPKSWKLSAPDQWIPRRNCYAG